MSINLFYISNEIEIAKVIDESSIDYIFIDLEFIGKEKRQKKRDTVISKHCVSDISKIKKVISSTKILCRVNPIGAWSYREINEVIDQGADLIMLPFFKSIKEVETFLRIVDQRIECSLLFETIESISKIEEILSLSPINYAHVGLNDLHIQRKTNFMFEFISDGSMEKISEIFKDFRIPFGFGGIAKIGTLVPSADRVLAEHYRLGSKGVILSRSFFSNEEILKCEDNKRIFLEEVIKIREYEDFLRTKDQSFFIENQNTFNLEVNSVKENDA